MNNKITVLPNYLINWLEDNDYQLESCQHPDTEENDRSCLTYKRKGNVIYVESASDGTTVMFPFGGKDRVGIHSDTTEVEFLEGVLDFEA